MAKKHASRDESGRFAYDGLDRVLHEKARLGIMTSLVTRSEGASFNELKRLCSLTDGNLSRHLDVLQEAGLVEAWRGTEGGRPQTLYRLGEAIAENGPPSEALFSHNRSLIISTSIGANCRGFWTIWSKSMLAQRAFMTPVSA